MSKILRIIFLVFFALVANIPSLALASNNLPSWFSNPRQNNAEKIYGVAEGFTQEEATKYALADAAGRLAVSISAESQLIKEENTASYNEELRQRVKQSIEKINFSGYEVSQSEEIDKKFYAEVSIDREKFVNEQKERVEFIQKKINDLDKGSIQSNPIQRRTSLIKILDLSKELDLKARILIGAKENVDLKGILSLIARYQNELEKSSASIEFFFDNNSAKDLTLIIRDALNKEGIKVAKNSNKSDPNQITIEAKQKATHSFIYEAHLTKLTIDIENSLQGKILASNSFEVSGSSSLSEEESIKSALKALEQKIQKDGILKILGILN